MKKMISLLSFILLLNASVFFSFKKQNEKVIGVIVPMEHQALSDIVSGLKEDLNLASNKHIRLKVMNAQGDLNTQRAIIQQLIRDQCDVLVPIGTAASQMTVNLAKSQKILCLATDLIAHLPKSEESLQATFLNDELSATESLSFLHEAFPTIKKITLIYSSSEKVAKEIPHVIEAAASSQIKVQKLMVQTLPELYVVGQAIAPDSQAVFILKDHLIVSGIQTLIQQAEKRKIPVMSSDEGSVISGAAFAIGVKEANIGRQGAQMIKEILNGTPPESILPQSIKGPFPLFVNRESCLKQGMDFSTFIKTAEKFGFSIEYVNEKRK